MVREVKRGEVYWLDWNPGRGSEQSGRSPSLVIQNDLGNKFSPNTIVTSIKTSADCIYSFQIKVTPSESGLPRESIIDLAMLMTIDKARLGEKCGELSPDKMAEVDEAIKVSLGL
jgi:mRNA interferase MazF